MSGTKVIDQWYNMFRQYPEVFPDAYFRFLKANLEVSFNNETYIDLDTVLLTWKRYKRSSGYAKSGDFLLEKIVSLHPGDGKSQHAMDCFFEQIPAGVRCYLKVAKHNSRAISFYEKNGFSIIDEIHFGKIPGLLMLRD
jgi:hypothetical protein